MNLRRPLLVSPLLLLLACGGSEPPPPVTAEAVKPTAPPPPPAVDLSPVSEPPGLVFFARVSKSAEVLRVAGMVTHLPMPGPEAVGELLTGERTGKLVDLDQPVDVVASVIATKAEPSVQWAAAGALLSVEDAKATLGVHYKLEPGDNGATIVTGIGGESSADEDDGKPHICELAPSAGAAHFRLVCAPNEAALKALGPYLTRTTPGITISSDVHAEAHLTPLRPLITAGRAALPGLVQGLLGGIKDSTLLDLVDAATGEVADLGVDLEKVTLDGKLDDTGATIDGTLGFKTTTSLSARLLTNHLDRADVPPPAFWHLPVDADLAAFSRGTDTSDFEHPRAMLLKALGHGLDKEGIAEADRTAITNALAHLFSSSGALVYGKGQNFDDAASLLAGMGHREATTAESDRLVADMAGWFLFGMDESPARLQGAVKELVAAYGRPAIQKWAKSDAKGKKIPVLRLGPAAPAARLPKDTSHLVVTVYTDDDAASAAPKPDAHHGRSMKPGVPPPSPPKVQRAHDLHVYVVPDAGHVWLALGLNDALVVSKLKAALSDAPSAGTLASRAGLESLKDAHVTSGGFSTLRGSIGGLAASLDGAASDKKRSAFALLQTVPEAGMAPIVFTDTPGPGAGDAAAGTNSFRSRIPRAAIEGMVKYSMMSGKF